ncbi:MAG: 16S rRNA (guanine(527)-N(7))-methyltransferase RsmG [Terracidiphilus sp.]
MSGDATETAARLNALLASLGMEPLAEEVASRFAAYLALLVRWNARMNLTAVRDEEGILARHFVESIACARALPPGLGSVLDFGSGAGFPGIPIALCRPELKVTLAESQGKKAAFLNEAVRTLGLRAEVHSGRAETLAAGYDCVVLRAVDRMLDALRSASRLVSPGGLLAPMTTADELERIEAAAGAEFSWLAPVPLPGGARRVLALGRRVLPD